MARVHDDFPPIQGSFAGIMEWLDAQGGAAWQSELRFAPTFSEQSFAPNEGELREVWPEGAEISWLGGPAVDCGAWPYDTDGTPLTHVATLELSGLDGVLDRAGKASWPVDQLREGLPTTGYLQVFHDLQTFGYSPDDRDRGAWSVMVTTNTLTGQRPGLVDVPGPGNTPAPVCQPFLPYASFQLPSPLDLISDDAGDFDRREELVETLQRAWMTQRGIDGDYAIPSSHAYGYSSRGHHATTLEVLPEVLPLTGDDEYRLILEIESWTVLEGWFGDAGSLEVWMRHSDLMAGSFDQAWCFIRTD